LEFPDALAELLALVDVLEGGVAGRLHKANRTSGQHETLQIKTTEQNVNALVFLAQNVFG